MGRKEMNFDRIIKLVASVDVTPKYDYGCLMLELPDTIGSYWSILKTLIDPDDYDEDGFEEEPHITVQYGFAEDVSVTEIVARLEPKPCMVKFGQFDLFENDNDVLKMNIISPDLRSLNKKINECFEITSKYPDYNPHATIAYLKKGTGQKYIDKLNNPLKDKSILSNRFSFSSPKYEKEYFYAFKPKDFFK